MFGFIDKQKTLMWQYFIDGKESGKKKTKREVHKREVHMLLRKDLQPQQIKSLLSCWTRGKASAPPKLSSASDDTYEDVMEGMKIILCSIYYALLQFISV